MLSRVFPKIKLIKINDYFFISSPYLDAVISKTKIFHFGRRKKRFIIIKPRDGILPRAFLTPDWKITRQFFRICIGITERPLKISKIVGDMSNALRKRDRLRGQGEPVVPTNARLR